MALPAHGHIIEEPEEDYRGERNKKIKKQGWKEKDSFGKNKKKGWSKSQKKKKKIRGGESRAARDKICLESVQPHVSNS